MPAGTDESAENGPSDALDTSAPEPTRSTAILDGTWQRCEQLDIDGDARVDRVDLVEASGLSASTRFEDVIWSHNDSGGSAGVYAIGLDGSDRGFFELAETTAFDLEDMALVDDRIYLGDIGDNGRLRESVQIRRFDEPAPDGDAPVTDAATIEVVYPDEPTDAEGLLVDPRSDEIVILSKDRDGEQVATRIYSFAEPDEPTDEVITMDLVGEIDVAALESQTTDFSLTAVLFPGLLTAADISADGSLIAIRTYATVWLYPRAEGQTMADALLGQPCEGGTAAENQGEALAILPFDPERDEPDVVRYATVTEGNNPVINVVSVRLS